MRVVCNLRELRGAKSIREVEEETGVSRGHLSLIEHGRLLPADKDVPALEQAYGAAASTWYEPDVLLAIQLDSH